MKQIYRFKKLVGYLFSILLLGVAINSCNTLAGSTQNERKNNLQSVAKKVIFILNGLWQDVHSLDSTIKNLLNGFQAEGLVVEVRNLTENITSSKSITQQAKDAFEEIKQQLADSNYEIILVGHSQGGLRGAKILFLNEERGKPLDIKGLITLSTPWEGAPAATITKDAIHSFVDEKLVSYAIEGASHVYPSVQEITGGFIDNFFDEYFPTHEPGVRDMVPQSNFLQELSISLAKNSTPILAIAGTHRNVEEFIPKHVSSEETYIRYIKKLPPGFLNMLYARVFAGSWFGGHDMMVPLYSQLAKNISKGSSFEICILKDAVHDFLLPTLAIPAEKVIYNKPEAIVQIIKFAKSNFDFSGNTV